MIPAEFDYVAPESLDDAISALADGGEDAKVLAGGHSLIPLMKLRLAAPTLLVDLRRVGELRGFESNGELKLGAMTPHAVLEDTPELGLLSRAASTIADRQVRHRGTIGGSLVHGDPASDLPAVLLAMEGSVVARGPSGERTIPASELFVDYLETSLQDGEIVTEVHAPGPEGWGHGYQKFNRRREDWAMVAVCALVRSSGDTCEDVRVGLTNMGTTPLRASAVEEALRGQPLNAESIRAAAEHAADGTDPPADLNATADYKRHLARVLCARALSEAAGLGT
jgi:carbon-monoxide dehydrogenase medium subunit